MARILSLEGCPAELRNTLTSTLHSSDEAVILPQASRNPDSGEFSNITFKLDGKEAPVNPTIFSPEWLMGVSAVKVEGKQVDRLVNDTAYRMQMMQRLKEAIPSELVDSSLTVGPKLECDEADRDKGEWIAGFNTSSCFVGLYGAQHSRAPEPAMRGQNRAVYTTYLVCKAGAGAAGSTFHARLTTALKGGASLVDCLEKGTEPGPAGLRRVTSAGSRNRGRILSLAATALGLPFLDTCPDQSSCGRYRAAVTHIDVNSNVLRKIDGAESPTYLYTTGLDAGASRGLLTLSNASDGLALLLSNTGEVRHILKNEAYSSIPFSSTRIASNCEILQRVIKAHREATQEEPAHIDHEFIRRTFTWSNRAFSETQPDLEPLPLWGTHQEESFLTKFSRELGLVSCQVVHLRPLAVCLAGIDPGKLRAALRSLG